MNDAIVVNDAVAAFLVGVFLVIVGAVFYVLWDNSCKKFDDITKRQDACMEAIDARFAAADVMLEAIARLHPIYADMYSNVKEAHKNYTCAKNKLESCIKQR
jgi:hypothetical protein